jgi:hypothetical protein
MFDRCNVLSHRQHALFCDQHIDGRGFYYEHAAFLPVEE